jgi:hypothetical protein
MGVATMAVTGTSHTQSGARRHNPRGSLASGSTAGAGPEQRLTLQISPVVAPGANGSQIGASLALSPAFIFGSGCEPSAPSSDPVAPPTATSVVDDSHGRHSQQMSLSTTYAVVRGLVNGAVPIDAVSVVALAGSDCSETDLGVVAEIDEEEALNAAVESCSSQAEVADVADASDLLEPSGEVPQHVGSMAASHDMQAGSQRLEAATCVSIGGLGFGSSLRAPECTAAGLEVTPSGTPAGALRWRQRCSSDDSQTIKACETLVQVMRKMLPDYGGELQVTADSGTAGIGKLAIPKNKEHCLAPLIGVTQVSNVSNSSSMEGGAQDEGRGTPQQPTTPQPLIGAYLANGKQLGLASFASRAKTAAFGGGGGAGEGAGDYPVLARATSALAAPSTQAPPAVNDSDGAPGPVSNSVNLTDNDMSYGVWLAGTQADVPAADTRAAMADVATRSSLSVGMAPSLNVLQFQHPQPMVSCGGGAHASVLITPAQAVPLATSHGSPAHRTTADVKAIKSPLVSHPQPGKSPSQGWRAVTMLSSFAVCACFGGQPMSVDNKQEM